MTPPVSPAHTSDSSCAWVVLVIDDTPDNLILARAVLTRCGAQTYTASSGEEGLALLKTITPTVILLDIRMPHMSGYEVLWHIRSTPATAHLPVIAVTAVAMEGDREQMLAAGFNGYLSKPYDVLRLADDIRAVLQHAR